MKNAKQLKAITGFTAIIAPKEVATPFPPLNPRYIGQLWPITTNTTAMYDAVATSVWAIVAITFAINTAITPFNKSPTNVNIPAFFPNVLRTFVDPAFPEPWVLISTPIIFFAIIYDVDILPIKYDTKIIIR